MQHIYSKNATYQKFEGLLAKRSKRTKHGEFIIEGVRNINEAIKHGWQIKSFIYPQKRQLSRWATGLLAELNTEQNYSLTEELQAELSNKSEPSELLALASTKPPPPPPLSPLPLLALFDRPSNKGNLGTLIRSCDALGIDQLLITGHAIDIYEPEVIGASMGSFFKLPIKQLSTNEEINKQITNLRQQHPSLLVLATTEEATQNIQETNMQHPTLIMLGNEKSGLNHHLLSISNQQAKIPMNKKSAATSLNVSCAATVIFYEALRQRG